MGVGRGAVDRDLPSGGYMTHVESGYFAVRPVNELE